MMKKKLLSTLIFAVTLLFAFTVIPEKNAQATINENFDRNDVDGKVIKLSQEETMNLYEKQARAQERTLINKGILARDLRVNEKGIAMPFAIAFTKEAAFGDNFERIEGCWPRGSP